MSILHFNRLQNGKRKKYYNVLFFTIHLSEMPDPPRIDKKNIIVTVTEISLSWEPVTDAQTYEIVLKGPNGERQKVSLV